MEGVGARLGRSSTRYGGPATVFTGRVRKWKKKWVSITNPNNNNRNHNSNTNNNDPSPVVLYKWTPIPYSKDPNSPLPDQEQPPRKCFRYIPVAVLEEEKEGEKGGEEEDGAADGMKIDDDEEEEEEEEENEGGDDDVLAAAAAAAAAAEEATPMEGEGAEEEAADVGDVKDEAQVSDKDEAQAHDVNRASLDLNLGLKYRDSDSGSDPKMEEEDEGSKDQMGR